MISNAFKGAYTNQVAQQNQGINTISSGVKSAAVVAALGFAGPKGLTNLAKKVLPGLGGALTDATKEEKSSNAQEQQDSKKIFTGEEVTQTIGSTLGTNPINRSAVKQLSTVFEMLSKGRESGVVNPKGQIESSIGNIDPTSELGKRVLAETQKEDK